jgi:hypothetical protein
VQGINAGAAPPDLSESSKNRQRLNFENFSAVSAVLCVKDLRYSTLRTQRYAESRRERIIHP